MTACRPEPARTPVPAALAAAYETHSGASGRAWIAALPALVAEYLDRWELRPDGGVRCGRMALVLPVLDRDGAPAVLKLQPVDAETCGEPPALRRWDGDGAVRLLRHDPASGTMLLERLDADRSLASLPDDTEALRVLSGLLARLTAHPAPEGLRTLTGIAKALLDRAEQALPALADPADRRLLGDCAARVRELLGEPPGDRLLHWDLHHDNVLAAPATAADRGPWLAIDPKPLVGDPAFELFPALWNRWDALVATGDVVRSVRRRFDLMTEALSLDRERARGWTLGRVLQNCLWRLEQGQRAVPADQRAIAEALSE
ncbi:aminoglycoside phosphotransferase family protein [Streptomyces sp. TP-A0874]|uniref:aminoglycoside phosphotransferase family protein n=1 Tax=Streptomyces sp. TP-A0874 TaxID=549819 RepID=UPI00085293AC|nr:aminoglycoside phosphotransferase family protein [Streptomyces sp. TP-A0874]